jgi:hypothetical protein
MNGVSSSRWHSRVERVWRGLDPFPGPDQFDSTEDYLEFADAIAQLHSGLPPRLPKGLQEVRPSRRAGGVQVGLRLPMADFDRLAEFGRAYGVAPATMARILVVRALRAVAAEDESS